MRKTLFINKRTVFGISINEQAAKLSKPDELLKWYSLDLEIGPRIDPEISSTLKFNVVTDEDLKNIGLAFLELANHLKNEKEE